MAAKANPEANARRHVVHANVMCNLNRHDTNSKTSKYYDRKTNIFQRIFIYSINYG